MESQPVSLGHKISYAIFVFAVSCTTASAQFEGELTAKRRIFPEIGAGVRAIRSGANGHTYILTSQSLLVFDEKERPLGPVKLTVPASKSSEATFLEACDIDSDGTMYLADRAANLISILSADGQLLRTISVSAPLSLAVLPDHEVAVATAREPHLITVFDKNGREIREFGELEDISSLADLNRFLNAGFLASDGLGRVEYAFVYAPEPTIRQYDRNGYATQTIQYAEIDAFATAQAARKEIERQERRGKEPAFKPVLTALGVVRDSGEVWIALHSHLLRFDQEGNRKATYRLYTPDGNRLEAMAILIEKERILVGNDPLGVYEFERPDLKLEEKLEKH